MASLGVEVVILMDQRVLLVLRDDFNVWALPGGGVDPNESLVQAAMREVREETGLVVTLSRLVGFYSRPDWCNGGDNDALYVGQPTSGRFINESNEVRAIGFFDPDDLPHPMVGWHRQRIRDAVSGAIGVTRTQHTPWPFDSSWSLADVRRKFRAGELDQDDVESMFYSSQDSRFI
ncbi:MAG: NUDIX hydrolase [Candidatus Latescibacterota bacterium]|nr:NUDIX hydrolase [Candidatus Latescibacterota bacterium]MEE2628734.1 NUDIX hydrolase [Candidatus Latescibacterota bacterium]MEE2728177.1 NUDIX hydrolase [Candidatus Latescibacterota bacterium]